MADRLEGRGKIMKKLNECIYENFESDEERVAYLLGRMDAAWVYLESADWPALNVVEQMIFGEEVTKNGKTNGTLEEAGI